MIGVVFGRVGVAAWCAGSVASLVARSLGGFAAVFIGAGVLDLAWLAFRPYVPGAVAQITLLAGIAR